MFKQTPKNLVYLFIIFIAFLLFFSRSDPFRSLQFFLIEVTTKPASIITFPLKELKKIVFYHRTFEAYKEEKGAADRLKAQLVGLEEVVRENTRLQQMLKFKRQLIYSSVVANVIGRDPSRWNAAIIIDKGIRDGLKKGVPVVSPAGVVGKVIEAGSGKSKVLLLTDPQFAVAGLLQQSRETGVISGTLEGLARMRFIDPQARISVGDKIITSKLSSSFPEGLLVGEVVQVEDSFGDLSQECLIQPAVSFSQLEEVLVILN